MKRIMILLISFFGLLTQINAQTDYKVYDFLSIIIGEKGGADFKAIYYPEGSTYEVLDVKGKKAVATETDIGSYSFTGELKLIVYPEYRKNKPDTFKIKQQKLRIFTTAKAAYDANFGAGWDHDADYNKSNSTKEKKESVSYSYNSNGITAEKKLFKSTVNPGKFNLELKLSNGIIFTYEDGKYKAKLNDEQLDIEGKYIIKTYFGVAKISFDPQSGVVYWIFEKPREKQH